LTLGIEHHVALRVSAHEVTDTEDVQHARPAMGVNWDGIAGADVSVENADVLVFEQQGVILGRGGHGVQFGRIWPGLLRSVADRNVFHWVSEPTLAAKG
jgi:hypothetical protein